MPLRAKSAVGKAFRKVKPKNAGTNYAVRVKSGQTKLAPPLRKSVEKAI